MKKTLLQIKELDEIVAKLYSENPKLKDGKFGYAWNKIITKNYNPIIEELNDKMQDNRIEYALIDEQTKEILIGNDKNYKYSKEGMKSLLKANRELLKKYNNKEIEIIPYFVKEENLPKFLEEEKELFKGVIIK